MRRRAVIVAAVAVLLLAVACRGTDPSNADLVQPGEAATTLPRQEAPVPQAALDAIATRYLAACKSPGAAVGLRQPDGTTRFATAGQLAPGVPIDRNSQFLAGSVTKLFVASVAYQMVAAHQLSLDATVDQFLPTWPRGHQITVAMLLGHRSGMGDFGNDFGPQLQHLVLSDLTRTFTYPEVLDLVRAVPPVAAPGVTYHYTNANYIVLGAILVDLTGHGLGQLFDTRLIGPLKLDRTLYGPDDLPAANAVVFHGLFDIAGTGTPVDIGTVPRQAALTVDPAGAGLFSTLPDLLTFAHALFATSSVLPATMQADLDASVSTLGAKDLLLDHRFVIHGHGGASPGAQTIVAYDQTHATTVAVWCNRLDPGELELLPSVVAAKETFELAAG